VTPAEADCIFCAIVAGTAPARIVREDERTVAFLDIAPITRGHTLVIPRAHSRDLLDVPADDLAAAALAAQDIGRRAVTALDAAGVNLLQATGAVALQTVFHVHIHVLPRFADDPVELPEQFIKRRAGDPAELDALAARLRDADPGKSGP
jgi:histidine triad (HIT) family protein